ncbi:hypothetical protein AURDEDRAFT_170848 [Auricularia subglabra TFB-10046 SS5]|nr:hypothetical protein AURDEDRAFT_170848 [Auricularia subglabra TFB-10046 SS5]
MPPLLVDLTVPCGVAPSAAVPQVSQPKPRAPASRVKEKLATALERLRVWRLNEWLANWQDTGLVLDDMVPDSVLHALAKCLKIFALGDVQLLVPDHVYQLFGESLLEVMLEVRAAEVKADSEFRARREAQKAAEREQKEAQKAAEREQKDAERERKRLEKAAARSRSHTDAAEASNTAVKRSASPSDSHSRPGKRSRALADATNAAPRAGPSRQRSVAPQFAFPAFNFPSLAGRPAPRLSDLPPLPLLPPGIPPLRPPNLPLTPHAVKAED